MMHIQYLADDIILLLPAFVLMFLAAPGYCTTANCVQMRYAFCTRVDSVISFVCHNISCSCNWDFFLGFA
jgi:hypothetical protein